MVATISALTNSAQTASYYELDDYYSENGTSNSKWIGKGAEELGLSGEVDSDTFKSLLEGKVACNQLGTMRDGELEHRPGWDLTFSAPKSVSVLAEIAGDRRLIDAHEKAVQTALSMVEEHLAVTRIREDGSIRRENTENLVIASFRHGTSRDVDPQLHSHNVILNMTQDAEGKWRSLEPRAFYQLQKSLGAIYRQELAEGAKSLGYEITWGNDSTFEIAGIEDNVLTAFSQRSAAIEARLAERGKTRKDASAAEKQIAALDTRQKKKQKVSHSELIQEWRRIANELGWNEAARKQIIAEARQRAKQNELEKANNLGAAFERETEADKALNQAIATLSERQSVFSTIALHEAAGKFANGGIAHNDITKAINRAEKIADLETRDYIDKRGASFKGYTSRLSIETEAKMLALENNARSQAKPMLSPFEAGTAITNAEIKSGLNGHEWNDEQRQATAQILTSKNKIIALQGSAGTAKTSTVLATIAKKANEKGIKVTALAPTASAAQVLGEALGTNADTLARHLLYSGVSNENDRLWIVDEASLISTKNMAQLFEQAEKYKARVLLVGDTAQLGSIEAGAAFNQLQENGIETAKLTNILRQTNEQVKAAVMASLEGDAKKALEAIDNGGGKIIEYATRDERFAQIANDYANLDEAQRRKTLIIEPSREGRNELTKQIREHLTEKGILSGEKIQSQRLISRDLTKAEAKDIHSYEIGNTIIFSKDYEHKGITKDQAYEIKSIEAKKNAIILESKDGQEIDWRIKQWGANKSQSYTKESIDFQKGDKIQFTKNDRALDRINGQQAEVIGVETEKREITLKSVNNRKITLSLDEAKDQHVSHNYVLTAFSAQGRTAQNVILNAESTATHLIDQKSFYVAISRAKETTTIYTDNREKLVRAIHERSGEKQVALENKAQIDINKANAASL